MGSSDDKVVAVIMVGGPTKGMFHPSFFNPLSLIWKSHFLSLSYLNLGFFVKNYCKLNQNLIFLDGKLY